MRTILAFLFCLTAGTACGLALTWWASDRAHGLGAEQAGAWRAWPREGTPDADPYSRAVQARSGVVPLGPGEGVALFAGSDSDGRPLDGRCRYRVAGTTPTARYWTLDAFSPRGRAVAGMLGRVGFTSQEILRHEDGSFAIILAPDVQPGNWLQIAATGPFVLVLRLYETAMTANAFTLEEKDLPRIDREACP